MKVLCQSYRKKRDSILKALERHMPKQSGISWTHPHGGLYVWLTLPKEIDTSRDSRMFQRCVAEGVLYVPGNYCFVPDEHGEVPTNHLRLSFGQVAPDKIEPGINAWRKVVQELSAMHASVSVA